MQSTAVRRVIRVVTATTVAVAASSALLLAPVSSDAGNSLKRNPRIAALGNSL